MPSPLPDLRDFYDPALTLTVGGKEYRVEPPSQKQTLAVRAVITGAAKVPDREYLDRIFALVGATRGVDGSFTGGLVDEMNADGCAWAEVMRVAETAALHYGDSAAEGRSWWSAELLADAIAQSTAPAEALAAVADEKAAE